MPMIGRLMSGSPKPNVRCRHDFERHGEFGADFFAQHDVARVTADVPDASGPAGAGDPAGDAFADAESEFRSVGGETFGSVDFEESIGGIYENSGAAAGAHQSDCFAEN